MSKFKCSECEYNSYSKYNIKLHVNNIKIHGKSVNFEEIKTNISCEFCEKSISTIPNLKKHLKICKVKKQNLEEVEVKSLQKSTITSKISKNLTIPVAEEVNEEIQEKINNAEVLSFNCESILDTKINEIFNSEEKQLFSVSFRGYLKHNPNLDFVVDLDSVWKWIGYKNKGNAKRALLKSEFLVENIDYIFQIFASQLGEAKTETENEERRGGHNKETILMTVNAFKKFCMMAATTQSHKMHNYYIKLEQCIHEVRIEEMKNFKLQIKDKDAQKEKNLIKNFNRKPIVYLATVEKDIISFGYTNDVKRRLKEHKKIYGMNFTLEYCFESLYNRELETGIKNSTDLYSLLNDQLQPRIFNRVYNGQNQTELIKLDTNFTLEKLYKVVCKIKDSIDNIEIIKNLNVRNNELKDIIREIVTK
jgi:phage anti-repressor protein